MTVSAAVVQSAVTLRASDERVLIVGGNIAGLATAVALRRLGLEPVVLERMESQPRVGGGLHIWTNGAKALEWLGAHKDVRSAGEAMEVLQFRRWDGRRLVDAPVGSYGSSQADKAFFVPRADVPRALLAQADGIEIRWGAAVAGYEEDDAGVTVRLADGEEVRGAVLVGADGINSGIRRQLLGEIRPRYAGYQDWGAVFEFEHPRFPPGEFWILFGPGARAGLAHIGGRRVYFAASIPRPEADSSPPDVAELRRVFSGWVDPIEEIIAATPPDAIAGAPIRELPRLDRWTGGRVALIGDAAHAMQPCAGRGASEALEDGITLAAALAELGDLREGARVSAALTAWADRRRKPVGVVMKRSKQIGTLGLWSSPLAGTVRDVYLRAIAPLLIRQMKIDFAEPLPV